MNRRSFVAATIIAMTAACGAPAPPEPAAPAPNAITLPQGYQDWKVIGVSHRTDKNSLRVIVGNEAAVAAARSGNTNPWPDGVILGKLAWKDLTHASFPAATVPGELTHVEFMVKDKQKYATTGGWGYARWLGMEKKPYGDSAAAAQECFDCHTTVKDTDYVFTRPIHLP